MPIPDHVLSTHGRYLIELDINHGVMRVKKKGDPKDYTTAENMTGTHLEKKHIEICRTDVPGNTVYCWFRTATGQYIKVPC